MVIHRAKARQGMKIILKVVLLFSEKNLYAGCLLKTKLT